MNDEQPWLMSPVDAIYLPVLHTHMEKSTDQPPPSQSARSIIFRKYAPFGLHFALTILVASLCLVVIDGRAFNSNSPQPQYSEVGGSVSHRASCASIQSGIMTVVSFAATATRVAAGWWGGGYIWRCIFLSMERGGISLRGLSQVVTYWPPAPRHFTRRSNMVIILITLLATYTTNSFSAALTGSIVWETENGLVLGDIPITGIARGVKGTDLTRYFTVPQDRARMASISAASANLLWGVALQPDIIPNFTQPSMNFRRIIPGARGLPINSTLTNVTMPYFVVDAFDWIKNPNQTLTDKQIDLFHDNSEFNPYLSYMGGVALLPDSQWGPPNKTQLGDPHVVSETRLLTFRVGRFSWDEGPCSQNAEINLGSQINLYEAQYPEVYYDCFAIANVTYRAGAARCQNCEVISPAVVEAQAPLPLVPDSFTSMALGFAPLLATNIIISEYAIPGNYGSYQSFCIELTSRAYQVAWATYSDAYGNQLDDTAVEIALPTLRARVIKWRVYLWVALHFGVLALGLIFVHIQSHCDHPWVKDPTMAFLWLETSEITSRLKGHGVDPWQPGTEIPMDGMLMLEKTGQRSRSVKVRWQ